MSTVPSNKEVDDAADKLAAASDLSVRRMAARQEVLAALRKLAELAMDGAERIVVDSIRLELQRQFERSK